jgi:hypothetical protein
MASAGFALAELLEELSQALPRGLVPLDFAVPAAGGADRQGRGPERQRRPSLRGPEPAAAVVALVHARSATVGEAMDNHG